MKHQAKLMAYIAIGIITLTAAVSCDQRNDLDTQKVEFSVIWTNKHYANLYITDTRTRELTGVTFHLKDTILHPGESITIATANREINPAEHGDKETYKVKLFTRLRENIRFSMKYEDNQNSTPVLRKIDYTSDDEAFDFFDYKNSTDTFTLSITDYLLNKVGTTTIPGKFKQNIVKWNIHTTVPFSLICAVEKLDVELFNQNFKPGDIVTLTQSSYCVYPGEEYGFNIINEKEVCDKIFFGCDNITLTAPNLLTDHTLTKFDISTLQPYIFNVGRYERQDYGDDSTVHTLSVYNETLFREFPMMCNKHISRVECPVSWRNGTDEDMNINLQFKEHLAYSIGKSHFNVTLAPGEKLQLNPVISYGEFTEDTNPDIQNDAAAWNNYISEIQSLTIKYGDNKEYVLDKANPAEFILNTKHYRNGTYYIDYNSFPK